MCVRISLLREKERERPQAGKQTQAKGCAIVCTGVRKIPQRCPQIPTKKTVLV